MIPAILHRDRNALVIDKPAGLAVHPGPRTPGSLEDLLPAIDPGARRPPTPVHRLDRDTSGCLCLARGPAAHRALADAFARRTVRKAYLAVVRGVAGDAGVVEAPLAKVSSREAGWRMVARAGGAPATTRWRVLGRRDAVALVLMEPLTGRTHQLRVHAAALGPGAAIAGDPVYGDGVGPMLLHAWRLELPPLREAPAVSVTARLPSRFSFPEPSPAWP